MTNPSEDDVGDNRVNRPSYFLLKQKPWQILHHIIDEGKGVELLSVKRILQRRDHNLFRYWKCFDEDGQGIELQLLLRTNVYQDEDFENWINTSSSDANEWLALCIRNDSAWVCGPIVAFKKHEEGVVIHIYLFVHDRELPPNPAVKNFQLNRVLIKFGSELKTRKTVYANTSSV
ncbi:MAG: hypothetical protein KC662_01270 [Candidatus Magasanikbacteria bacterium]|nr:hypothetical protein [Candidatus Magasanikbacteria bacterium]